jgi:hypothetical protein
MPAPKTMGVIIGHQKVEPKMQQSRYSNQVRDDMMLGILERKKSQSSKDTRKVIMR